MVVRPEHIVTPDTITATFTTRFRHDNRFGVAVPVEMGEKIEGGLLGTGIVEGQARYTNFKRFEVQTEGKVNAP